MAASKVPDWLKGEDKWIRRLEVIGIFGLLWQVIQTQDQTRILNRTFAQSTRPVASFHLSAGMTWNDQPVLELSTTALADTFRTELPFVITNVGSGILVPHSTFIRIDTTLSTTLLTDAIEGMLAAESLVSPIAEPISPEGAQALTIRRGALAKRAAWHFQILMIYRDLYDNFYATEVRYSIRAIEDEGVPIEFARITDDRTRYLELNAEQVKKLRKNWRPT